MRANAKIEPEKDTYKLMNNALIVESFENPLKHLETKTLTDENEITKSVSEPTFKDIFRNKDAALIEFSYRQNKYDKPIYLGATVLELMKLSMYVTFYNAQNPHSTIYSYIFEILIAP